MARDRSIKLIIQAQVDGAKRALQETAKAAESVGEASEKATKRASTAGGRLVQSARDNSQAWSTAGTAVAGFGAALTAGVGAAVVANAGFERSMSNVKAVTNASASEMDALTQSALDMGAATVFSASEAATAQAELARAGVSTADILGGALKGSMDLAAAGGLDLADAAIISAQAMNLFNLEGADVGHIADVLASGANKSAADVSDLGQALGQAGTVASQTGLSLEETVGALSMFADAGIRGSDAGTSLKSMLQRLTPQSKEAQRTMEDLGFSAFDAQGNFIGLEALAGELQSSFGGLDTESRQAALGVAFGADAIRSASVLMTGGAEAAAEYTAAMDDQGAAARMAATQMDNLAGDWEEFTGSLETALIQGGTAANGFIRGMVSGATDVVNAYNELPGAVQGGVTALAGIAGVAALGAGGLMILAPKAVETYDAFKRLAEISPRTASGLGKVARVTAKGGGFAVGLAAVATGLQLITQASWDAAPGVEEVTRALLDMQDVGNTGQLDDLIAQMGIIGNGTFVRAAPIDSLADAINRLDNPSAMQRLEDLDKVLPGVQTSGDRAAEALGSVDAALEAMVSRGDVAGAQEALAEALRGTGIGAEQAMEYLPGYREALIGLENDARVAAASGAELPPVMTEQEEAAQAATEALAEYQAELAGLSGSFLDSNGAYAAATEAAQAWAQGQADATETAEDSWETYVADFSGTADEYLAELERMAEAQTNWEANLFELIARGVPAEFVNHLAEMGPAAAEEVALVADMTDEELARWVELMQQRGGDGVTAFANGLTDPNTAAVLVAAGQKMGSDALEALALALSSGEMTLQEAIDTYDLDVELGADTAPFEEESAAALAEAEGKTAVPKVDADTSQAEAKSSAWEFDTNTMRPVPKVDADTDPAEGEVLGWYYDTAAMRPVPVMSADVGPAEMAALGWRGWASGLQAVSTVTAGTAPAVDAVYGLLGWIGRQSATVSVYTRAMGGLNAGLSLGFGNAAGAVYEPTRRASGGMERRPMMGGPGYGRTNMILWGEPETRGEAFISNHPAYKSQNIEYLRTAASWFGMDVVKAYAAGGVARQWSAPAAAAAPVNVNLDGMRVVLDVAGRPIEGVIRQVADSRVGAYQDRADYLNRSR